MLGRLSSLRIASVPDIILVAGIALGVFVLTVLWSLPGSVADILNQSLNKYLLAVLFLGAAAVAALVPRFVPRLWPASRDPVGATMVRFGITLQIIAVLTCTVGLWFASNPTRSVPVGFAAFTAMFVGLFVAGFG
ncbi:MAG: hypothetical protein M3380_03690, partial [Chloroflexota bacterium]|nr:hypothetical protein [Chloroflexota bacterium]